MAFLYLYAELLFSLKEIYTLYAKNIPDSPALLIKPLFSNMFRMMDKLLNFSYLSRWYVVEKYNKSNKVSGFLDFSFWLHKLNFCIRLMTDRPEIFNLTEIIWTMSICLRVITQWHYLRKLIGFWIHINQWAKLWTWL